MYASAVGTTVLNMIEIAPRPPAFEGVLCVFEPKQSLEQIRERLSSFGEIFLVVDRRLTVGRNEIAVHFATHQAALDAIAADPMPEMWSAIGTLYNDRPYDRRGW